MIRLLLNSPTDSFIIAPPLVPSGLFLGTVANTMSNIAVQNTNKAISGSGATSVCGWDDPYKAYPADPCTDIPVFPSVAAINTGSSWILRFTFSSCNDFCNVWSFIYSGPHESGEGVIPVSCTTFPFDFDVPIHPATPPPSTVVYDYTVIDCCGSRSESNSLTLVL